MLSRDYGLVYAGMRSGKTLSALTAIHRGEFRRVLVVTKHKAVRVWENEAQKFGFDKIGMNVWTGDQKLSTAQYTDRLKTAFKAQEIMNYAYPIVVVMNYEKLWREPLFSLIKAAGFELLILDESHKTKSHNGAISNALFTLSGLIPRRFLMTGTPMPNGPVDMYGQLRILHPKLVKVDPTRKGFGVWREHYCYLKPVRGAGPGVFQIDGYKNMEQFNAVMAGVTLRIKTEDVLDLPAEIHTDRVVNLSTSAMRLYKTFKKESIIEIDNGVLTASNILVKSLRLQQLAGGFLRADGSPVYDLIDKAKIEEITDMVDELDKDEPVVIVAKFTSEIAAITKALSDSGYSVSILTGQRDDLELWQNGKTQVLVMQINTGAEGISLVRSKRMIFYSVDYSLGTFDQVKARIYGPEQVSSTVYYDYVVAADTIDGAVYGALKNKLSVNEAVLSAIVGEHVNEYSTI